ncbi:MAG: hypothetical protein HYS61_00600 [Acidobacteria bacterium]|nr:hypothetical protein [Acidobacteriota bacterium]
MKIELNLSVAPSPRERYALAWAVPTTLVALGVLVLLSLSAARSYREYREVHGSVRDLRAQEARFRQRETDLRRDLEKPQLREVFRGVRFVNRLIDEKRFSVTELTQRVSKLLPPQVRLVGLGLAEGGNQPLVRIAVAGRSEEALEKFLTGLENSDHFREVTIISQGFAPEGAEDEPVRIACSARYLRAGEE